MSINKAERELWKTGLIVRLYLPFIRDLPKYFLILEVKDDWIVFTSMTSQQEGKTRRPNKYVISYEPPYSKFFGSLINYTTVFKTLVRFFDNLWLQNNLNNSKKRKLIIKKVVLLSGGKKN